MRTKVVMDIDKLPWRKTVVFSRILGRQDEKTRQDCGKNYIEPLQADPFGMFAFNVLNGGWKECTK